MFIFPLTLLAISAALMSPRMAADTWELRDLYSFGQPDPQGGRAPADPPILALDGALYGTTPVGGAFGKGVVYRFQPSDSSYLVLRHFPGGADGGTPVGTAFIQADDGRLYGYAVNPRLILYSLGPDGSNYQVVFTFPVGAEQGGLPTTMPSLTAGPDGMLYGIYVTGGPNNPSGTLFRISRDGQGYQVLANLTNPSSPVSFGENGQLFGLTFDTLYRVEANGSGFQILVNFPPGPVGTAQAEGGLVHASDGFIYGVTDNGGSFGFGTIFRVHEDGSAFEVIYEPNVAIDGGHYRAPALEGSDGYIYGALGENAFGVDSDVWRIRKDGTGWQVLRRIPQNGRGTNGVVEARDGFLYGCTPTGGPGGDLFRLARDGSSYTIVRNFPSTEGFPLTPIALVRGPDQRFYGLTDQDGTSGRGTLFRINPDGSNFSVLHDFGNWPAADQAAGPKAICAGPDGALYGIVRQQGSGGAGVFRFQSATGNLTWLQTFDSSILADTGTILFGSDGMLYGSIDTSSARTDRVFRLDTSRGNFAVVRTFSNPSGSGTGTSALTEGPDGLLYGVTTRNAGSSLPLLFRMARDGMSFVSLHDVTAGTNPGLNPPLGLLAAANGLLFGYASNALFRCNPDGSGFQTVHTFSGTTFSQVPLEAFDGKIYGALRFGGAPQRGSIFRMAADGSAYEELIAFSNEPTRGQVPAGTIITGPDGAFYGVSQSGGDANHGTIFRVATPAQIVGIAAPTVHFDQSNHFTGSVIGPPGRPVDVLWSDDLQSWTFLQRIEAPDVNPVFIDAIKGLPTRFYRAVPPY